jgi:sulfatase modifying factor 1
MSRLLALTALLFALPAHAEVTIEWLTVGDPGNVADTEVMTCCESSIGTSGYGPVGNEYRISKHEVTNAQYAEFLNAVAATDANALYNTGMGSGFGGITRSGSSGSFNYSAIAGREDLPVDFVSFWDAARFANWLHNGQPTGAQDSTTTEAGAYTLTPTGITNNTVTRNAGANVFVPSEDEWYKAAYYDTGAMIYFDYPAGSDTQTTCTLPGAVANTANCDAVSSDFFDVGSYTAAASPNGSFDQGGNAWEWSDTIIGGTDRGLRGGSGGNDPINLAASVRFSNDAVFEYFVVGFRVASRVPPFPQGIPALGPFALLVASAGLLGFGVYRRVRA